MNGTLVDRLRRFRRVHIDSMTFIYFIEKNPAYHPIVRPIFELLESRHLFGLSSFITLLEVMVHPIKKGRLDLAREYRDRLVRANNFVLFPVNQPIAEHGAEIRAKYEFRTPDAIQLATALRQGADAFVTNDDQIRRFDQIPILILDDFRPGMVS